MAVDMTEIKRNSDWYYANFDSLLPKYDGKFIGISDCSVVGVFNTFFKFTIPPESSKDK